jgi:hypothetical protein
MLPACQTLQLVPPNAPSLLLTPLHPPFSSLSSNTEAELLPPPFHAPPWKIHVHKRTVKFFALTMIDTTTTISKIVHIKNKTSQHVAMQFENAWLARYPKPLCCVHDPGSEFIGAHFQSTLAAFGIGHMPCTPKNPQSNAICECMPRCAAKILHRMLQPQSNWSTLHLLPRSTDHVLMLSITPLEVLQAHLCSSKTCSFQSQSWMTTI